MAHLLQEQFLQEHYVTEIVRLHDFFQEWFSAAVTASDEQLMRFTAAMAADFVIVSPAGQLSELSELTSGLRGAYGKQPDIRIWTQNHHLRWQRGNVALCTYEEWQETTSGRTARLSSVLFQPTPDALHGLYWLHVHETWLQK